MENDVPYGLIRSWYQPPPDYVGAGASMWWTTHPGSVEVLEGCDMQDSLPL